VRSKLRRAQSITSTNAQQFAVSVLGNGSESAGQCLDDYPEALWLAVRAGGDRDTICAIVGGVVACYVGLSGIPEAWLSRRESLPKGYLPEAHIQ
jgi:ADP-ribosylglycohydrolase